MTYSELVCKLAEECSPEAIEMLANDCVGETKDGLKTEVKKLQKEIIKAKKEGRPSPVIRSFC